MKWLRHWPGILFSTAILGLLITVHLRRPSIPVECTWGVPPRLVLCDDAPITMERLEDAERWWSDRGARFHPAVTSRCLHYGHGDVHVMAPGAGRGDDHGDWVTPYYLEGSTVVAYVVVELADARGHIPEHAIGHALCLGHWNQQGHLMHQRFDAGGFGDRGVSEALDRAFRM